ncbi:hypothetical protein GCM10010156_66270 [Planobispora rosea]|uniref:Uncharacterized protein n=1 Tax=Planobispora rosea TaxID=35762 RepID=A0A8J3WHM3_PLARO|nr:hypothetical protein [Planobispora rosea]GGS98888.1 hypothetical protein GCM10010156_66270 [Planobispora rosea]GIH87991.1 hypothetical protein Pro02_63990 [Planobispora rosea]
MKIGFSFWGFIGPGILDTPDGGRFWRRPIIDELTALGHQLVLLQTNRDLTEAGDALPYQWDAAFPAIDVLLCEWRWPLPGRNTTPCGSPGHTCDLHRQQDLLDHYTTGRATPTVIWDTDRQMPADDPLRSLPNVIVCDTARRPVPGAAVLFNMVPDETIDAADPERLAATPRPLALAYVGNQYDRDEAFTEFFAPAAARFPHRVAGKWTRTAAWPQVNFTGRCPFPDIGGIYRGALSTVMLLPDRYARAGALTQRLGEAVVQGCMPITPTTIACAQEATPGVLHAADAGEVIERIEWLQGIAGTPEHVELIDLCLRHLEPMRVSKQIATLNTLMTDLAEATHAGVGGER